MNDAGFGVYLTNWGSERVGRWYGLEDFPLTHDRIFRDIGLDDDYNEYLVTDRQGCPRGMGEFVSIGTLNAVAGWVSDQVDLGTPEEAVCALLASGALHVNDVVAGRVRIYLHKGLHTMAEIAQEVWDGSYYHLQSAIESSGMGDYVAFDAEAFGRDLDDPDLFVDTEAGIFEIDP